MFFKSLILAACLIATSSASGVAAPAAVAYSAYPPLPYTAAAAPLTYPAAPLSYPAAPLTYPTAPLSYPTAPLSYPTAPLYKTVAAPAPIIAPAAPIVAPAAPLIKAAAAVAPVAAPLAKFEYTDSYPQYRYAYNIQDSLTGDSKTQEESREGEIVKGRYSLIEADGSRRIVSYYADPLNGFNAIVQKELPVVAAAAPLVKAAPAVLAV